MIAYVLSFAVGFARSCWVLHERGRRCPTGALAVAVGAWRRLRCAPRLGGVPQNSLRSLRSLRSDSCGKSVFDAPCGRRHQACGTRRPRQRPRRAPPAAHHQIGMPKSKTLQTTTVSAKRRPGSLQRAWAAPRNAGAGAARDSALRQLTCRSCLSAAVADRVASSAAGPGPEYRRAVGHRPTAAVARCGLPGRRCAAPLCTGQSSPRKARCWREAKRALNSASDFA